MGFGRQQMGGMYGGGQQYQPLTPRTQSPYQTPSSVFGILGRDNTGYGMPQNYGINPYAGGMGGKGGQMRNNYMGGMGYRPQPNYYLSPFGGPYPLNQFAPYNPYAGANFYSNLMGYQPPEPPAPEPDPNDVVVDPYTGGPIGTWDVGAGRGDVLDWANQRGLIGEQSLIDPTEYEYLKKRFATDEGDTGLAFGAPNYQYDVARYPDEEFGRTMGEFNQLVSPFRAMQDQKAWNEWWPTRNEVVEEVPEDDPSVDVSDWWTQYGQYMNPYAFGKGGGWW